MNIGFIGLGKLGFPCALAMEEKGHRIFAFDSNSKINDYLLNKAYPHNENGVDLLIQKTNISMLESSSEVVNNSDIIFVPIQTPHSYQYEGVTRLPDTRDDFDYSYLINCIKEIKPNTRKIVVIISTVLPGTIEKYILPIKHKNVDICYNPYFIAMGTVINDFLNPEFVLLGCDNPDTTKFVSDFYNTS